MPQADPAIPDVVQPPPTPAVLPAPVKPRVNPTTRSRPKQQPPYAVVLHNDDVNRIEWVVGVLRRVLRVSTARAVWLTMKIHVTGRGVVWTGMLEVAELKAEQLRGVGPDPRKASAGARPLGVTIEQLPG